MAWIELHQSLWTHRKTLILAAMLQINETYAGGHLSRFWTWALDNAQDGDLSGLPDLVIAFGAGWQGDATAFVNALVKAGWIDRDGDQVVIHDWHDYAGRLAEKKKANKLRMQKARESRKMKTNDERAANVQRTNDAQGDNEQGTGETRNEHVQGLPNLTIPNHIITIIPSESGSNDDGYNRIVDAYCELHQKGTWQLGNEVTEIHKVVNKGVPTDFAIIQMNRLLSQKQEREGQRFRLPKSFSYYSQAILDAWDDDQLMRKGDVSNAPKNGRIQQSGSGRAQTQGRNPSFSDDELDELVV
ncbi:hypothetical protein ACFFSY_13680 [Paenibacillus aurantiacus]|uniref:Uncharacterized protein n=1 Tax=Paenibacillus aurantiacus TaxID=1936118 RepID=A0ABV5KRY1_9BACL